ncbi:MAG: ribonuclease P protein subunit [Promethearchaeota archaeon]
MEKLKYFIYRDMIGLKVWVKPKNKRYKGPFIYAGTVIDETYNLIITSKADLKNSVEIEKTKKKYVKKDNIFRFEVNLKENNILYDSDKESIIIEIDGNRLLKRPDMRIKKIKKIKQL